MIGPEQLPFPKGDDESLLLAYLKTACDSASATHRKTLTLVVSLLQLMRAEQIPFTKSDYGNLILAYVNVGRLEEAEGVLQDMRARNIQPELVTYNTLLDGYGRQGRYEEAESVLADMKQVGALSDW